MNYLALDLGAESGRAVLGRLEEGRLQLRELRRFANQPVRIHGALYWDALRLWHEIQQSIAEAAAQPLDGVGIDTWGVDFGLLGSDGALLENPRHYRDSRTHGVMEDVFRRVPCNQVFAATGTQLLPFNTLYQLYAMKRADAPAFASARMLLNMPDLFNYWLTGETKSEITIASTTQFFDPRAMSWATNLLERLDLPSRILAPLVAPGTRIGSMLNPPQVPIYATASHDTAAAVAAVPAAPGSNWCYISSGTWSLMGVELERPILDERCLALGFTNEVGVSRTIRLLKNIAGLWPLQECRRAWSLEGHSDTYEELTAMAAEARPFCTILDPDAFGEPGDMPSRIDEYCRNTGQEPPRNPAECARALLEGLALRYRFVLERLEKLTGRKIEVVHIVGGGSRNNLLNQFAADSTGVSVLAGPAEAAAVGNILVQSMGARGLHDLEEFRGVVRRSFALSRFEPHAGEDWGRAYEHFLRIVQ